MKLLRNFDRGNQYFNMENSNIFVDSYDLSIIGWYKIIDSVLSGVFVANNNLYLLWSDKHYLITDSSKVALDDNNFSNQKKMEFKNHDVLVFSFNYEPEENYSNVSPFEYIDYENYDWGLFLSNIVNNKSRKEVFINNINRLNDHV